MDTPLNYCQKWSLPCPSKVISSASESDFPIGSGNRLYLKDTQGYKSLVTMCVHQPSS
ncbi:BQ5605_C014g07524 [Microbotryum silenes-dioicae]|uniref:BQ5605_C014g07524 protein n=1 Tax=Microbotryum silenes-dioicae TaxID=796604 RepID=A0A2X0LXV1_9BASI|nr:BQ5605_C014g07524 [Microbotryum silenes-dioicae]